jgi:hypothetical protein
MTSARAYYPDFRSAIIGTEYQLMTWGEDVDPGHWQGVPTDVSMVTKELMDVQFKVPVQRDVNHYGDHYAPDGVLNKLRDEIQPNLPWADDHFAERVSRNPTNPGEAYLHWPWWRGQELEAKTAAATGSLKDFRFSHTYQERFWPKEAGKYTLDKGAMRTAHGIRYEYGDLDDVVTLLVREPHTRQAYLPIFFPEDTGAVHGGRIPCTLGYHFLLRNNQLHTWYTIRSCDWVRHFRDDLYLAARLLLWVLDECLKANDAMEEGAEPNPWQTGVTPGLFHFHCFSLHVHKGDMHHVRAAN